MRIKFFTIIVLTFFTFSSCKKDNENPSNVLLISKTWKRGLEDKNTSTNPQGKVFYYPVQNCEKDDFFKFDLNGNLTLNRNADKCDQNELQTETQAYTLNRTTKELVINGTIFTLAEESNNQIKYYAPLSPSSFTGFQYVIFLLQ